jgi:hypothetical protein
VERHVSESAPHAAQGTLGVSSTSLWTLPVVLRPQAALSEMLPVRSAAGLHGTPNERSESPCECPFACRGRPLAASLAQSVRCRRDESARIATAHRYTPALHGLRCRRVDSPPSCMHIRAAATCIADRVCMFMWCVCMLARARQSLTKKSPLPALIMHIPAAAACRSHIPVTGSQCHECHIGRASVRVRARLCECARGKI